MCYSEIREFDLKLSGKSGIIWEFHFMNWLGTLLFSVIVEKICSVLLPLRKLRKYLGNILLK